jgi:hypothetical protein
MNQWLYNNQPITEDDVPETAVGFVYLIHNTTTGMKYVGRKLLTKAGYKTVKGRRKKIRLKSDWETYWGSNKVLLEDFAQTPDSFVKHIISFTYSKAELLYLEEKLQYLFGVLEKDDWYNSNIRTRLFKKTVSKFNSNQTDFIPLLLQLTTLPNH